MITIRIFQKHASPWRVGEHFTSEKLKKMVEKLKKKQWKIEKTYIKKNVHKNLSQKKNRQYIRSSLKFIGKLQSEVISEIKVSSIKMFEI